MTALRQKMIEDIQLRGLAKRTQESYVAAVRGLAAYYNKSSAEISEGELRHRTGQCVSQPTKPST